MNAIVQFANRKEKFVCRRVKNKWTWFRKTKITNIPTASDTFEAMQNLIARYPLDKYNITSKWLTLDCSGNFVV